MQSVPITTKVVLELRSWRGVLNTTLCDKVYQWLATVLWFSPGTQVSSTNKTNRHGINEILLKVALNTINCVLINIIFHLNIYIFNRIHLFLIKFKRDQIWNFSKLILKSRRLSNDATDLMRTELNDACTKCSFDTS